MKKYHSLRVMVALLLASILFLFSGCGAAAEAEEGDSPWAGGIPWIDSNLKSNIKSDDKLSPKDDFYLYANHDWLLATELKENESKSGPGYLSQEKTDEKAMLLLEDDTLKSHDAELVQSLYHALMDWDARNEAGMEPVMKTVQDIQGIENMEELSAFICDPVRSRYVPVFLKINNRISFDDSSRYITGIELESFALLDAAE